MSSALTVATALMRWLLPPGLLQSTMDGMSPVPGPGGVGAFLRARRAQLSPRDAGLPETGTLRKVAGLRREEVAQPGTPSHDALRILASRASADTERPDPAQQKDPNR